MFVGGGGGVGCNMLTLYGRGMTLSKGERGVIMVCGCVKVLNPN